MSKTSRLVDLADSFEFYARAVRQSQAAVEHTRHLQAVGSRDLYTDEGLAADLTEGQGWVRKWGADLRRVGREIAEVMAS